MTNRVKEFRKAATLSQTELARIAKTTPRTIFAIEEKGQDTGVSLALKLANALNCAVEDLFCVGVDEFGFSASTADKALWYSSVVAYTATELGEGAEEVALLLRTSGIGEKLINSYKALHTQGYEYMGEDTAALLRSEKLKAQQE
jgi:putative transcriptional regulator